LLSILIWVFLRIIDDLFLLHTVIPLIRIILTLLSLLLLWFLLWLLGSKFTLKSLDFILEWGNIIVYLGERLFL
jgi:hypothetical protein